MCSLSPPTTHCLPFALFGIHVMQLLRTHGLLEINGHVGDTETFIILLFLQIPGCGAAVVLLSCEKTWKSSVENKLLFEWCTLLSFVIFLYLDFHRKKNHTKIMHNHILSSKL